MPETIHSRELLQRLHSYPPGSVSALSQKREKQQRASLFGLFVCPWIPGVQLRAALMVIHSRAPSTHSALMKICFTSANPTTQQQSVPQVPPATPRTIHYRTCSAEVNTGSQILPHCAKRVVRLFTKLKDMKSTMISLDVTSSYNPRSPTLIIFCSFQQRNKNVSCLTQPASCTGLKEKNLAPRCPF